MTNWVDMPRRPPRIAALFALTAAASGCGPEVLTPRDPTPGVPHFKVATYNVLNEIEGDPATLAAVGATGADVICLQEVTPVWKQALLSRYSAEYPYMLFKDKPGVQGLAVLSRYPLTGSELQFVGDWHPAWHVSAQTPAGWLQILIVHLRANFHGNGGRINSYVTVEEDHLLETKTFVESVVPELPAIVLGDFNEVPSGASLKYLESLGYTNVLPLYRPGQYTWRQASVGDQLNAAIDHILFDDFMTPLNAYVVVRGNSDHIPVVAHFEASRSWPEVALTAQPSEALPVDGASAQN